MQFKKIKLISNDQNLANQTRRKNYPSKILFQTNINLNQEENFSRRRVILYVVSIRYYFSETKTLRSLSKVLVLREKNITKIPF